MVTRKIAMNTITTNNQCENTERFCSVYDLLYGFTRLNTPESLAVNRRVITLIPRKWRKDKVVVEHVTFLEFNE